VVVWAQARVAEVGGRVAEAVAMIERAVPDQGELTAPERDLALEEARLLVRLGAGERARLVLTRLVGGGWRREVAALIEHGDPSLGLAAQEALGLVSAYR
jgi:hypothetical protein